MVESAARIYRDECMQARILSGDQIERRLHSSFSGQISAADGVAQGQCGKSTDVHQRSENFRNAEEPGVGGSMRRFVEGHPPVE